MFRCVFIIDKEFNHVFLMEITRKLDAIMVEGIILDETIQQTIPNQQLLSRNDFTPNSDEYYQLLFDKIKSM